MSLKRLLAAGLLVVLVLAAAPALAQQETGSVSGVVADVEGNPLPGVQMTLVSRVFPTQTAFTRANGSYRFLALPPGNYTMTVKLTGFTTTTMEDVLVRVAAVATINVSLTLDTVVEFVTVTSSTPLVDVKKTGISRNVNEQYMQGIPSARDPWVMMEHTAGVQIDRQNIGGSESGQQSGFSGQGSRRSDAMWTYDGAEITDMAALGASPMYYDFDAFEEISISVSGNDPSIATGGMRINFVTKRGGNEFAGSTRFYFTDENLQNDPAIDRSTGEFKGSEFTADNLYPGYVGNAIANIKDYGVEFGGPIYPDRVFGWGSYGKQDIKLLVGTSPDNTQLTHWHGKLTAHIDDFTVANFTYVLAQKTKQGRGAAANRQPETTFNQGGPSPVYTFKLQRTFSDNFYLEGSFNYTGLGFFLEPQGGRGPQVGYDLNTGVWSGSYGFYDTVRPLYNVKADGNAYIAEALGGDHELKFGYSFRDAAVDSVWGFGGGAIKVFESGVPSEAWLIADALDSYKGVRNSIYLGDTYSRGRATTNLGVRFDHQTSTSLASESPPHVLAPSLFPALSFGGFDSGFAWRSLSPRLGFTYELTTGELPTIFRANFARYYAQMAGWEFHRTNTTFGPEVDFLWTDTNANSSIDTGETGSVIWQSAGFDLDNPNAPSPNIILETTAPVTDEVILGLEREVVRNVSVGGNFIWKKNHNSTWNIRGGIDSSNYFPVTYNISPVGDITLYELDQQNPGFNEYKQRPDFNTAYKAVELTLNKRFASGWMANAAVTLADFKTHFDSAAGYLDPTNVAFTDGELTLIGSGGSGRSGTFYGSARWTAKFSGMYQLPAGVNLAGFFQIREGYLNPQFVRSPNRPNGIGRVNAWTQPIDTVKLPTYWDLDLRGEKTIDIDRVRVHVIVDAFNIFNQDIILARHNQVNSSRHDLIRELMQGRTVRFGLRIVLN